VQTWIDTSAAGFTRVPCYFAWLQGPLWDPQTQQLVPAILPSITDEATTGFTFRLWLEFVAPTFQIEGFTLSPGSTAALATGAFVTDPGPFSLFAQQHKLYVSWIGCQMPVPISRCDAATSAATSLSQAPGSR
jgi:hypothetical protein